MINKSVGLRFYDVVNIDLLFQGKEKKNEYFEKMLLILLNKHEFGEMNEDVNKLIVNNIFDIFRQDCLDLRTQRTQFKLLHKKRGSLWGKSYNDLRYNDLLINKMFMEKKPYSYSVILYYNNEKYKKQIYKKHEGYDKDNRLCMLFPRVKSDFR